MLLDRLLGAGVQRLVAELARAARASPASISVCGRSSVVGHAERPGVELGRVGPPPLDRSTIWPYEDGEPGDFYYRATATRRRRRPSARWASSRAARRCSSRRAPAPGRRSCSRCSSRRDDRARRGRVLRDVGALPRARALGPPLRRVRPDRSAARRRRPDLARGAVEPVPDDARPRGRRAPRARRSWTRRPRRRSTSARSSTAPTRPALGDEVPGGHHDVLLGAVVCARDEDRPSACASSAGRARDHRAADEAWLRLRGLDARGADAPPHRDRDGDRRAARAPRRGRARSATRASAGCSRSTSRAVPRRREASRRRRRDRERDEPRRGRARRSRRAAAGRATASGNLVRLSVGLEPVDELWDDLNQALSS